MDALYLDGAFYIVTHLASKEAKQILEDENVSVCSGLVCFSGTARSIGHPLKPENSHLRERLIEAFSAWYFKHNDEWDEGMCYMCFEPASGFVFKDGAGYDMDFTARQAREFPFAPDHALLVD